MSWQRGHAKQASSFGGGSWSSVPALTLQESLLTHARFVQQGFLDALKFQGVGEKLVMDRVVQSNVVKSTLLQGVILISALAVKPLLRATHNDYSSASATSTIFYWLFHIFWLWPLAIAATYYSGLLRPSQETDRRRGAPAAGDYRGMTAKIVSDSYRALVTVNYFAVIFLLRYIPLLGAPLAFLYACVVDSYYCYEQHWLKNGWPFSERVKFLDSRWSYFIGFGFPITFVSWWSSDPLVNLALFSLFYPFYQVMATTAMPQPLDPNLPTSSLTISFLKTQSGQTSFSMAAAEGGEEARGRKAHPWVPVRIQVLFLADVVYSALSATVVGRKKDAAGPGSYGNGAGAGYNGGGPSAYGAGAGAGGYGGGGGAGYGADPTTPDRNSGGWRSDYGASPTGSTPGRAFGHAGMAATPPRRGHVMTESSVGVGEVPPAPAFGAYGAASGGGGGYADGNLDRLIRSAAGRKNKGD